MSQQSSNHDDILFSLLKDCKTLPIFLDDVFGFLSRRTDFYHVATEPNSPIGLPEGLAEQTVRHKFYKWKKLASTQNRVVQQEKIIPKTPNPPQTKFTTSDSYNGASFDTYSWSQSILEVDAVLRIPENTTAKDLNVTIQSDRISVKLKSGETLLDGELCAKCKHSDAIWSINQAKLEIHLDKVKEMWWNCFVQTEPKLDINKLDCSRPYEELPEEAQAKIEQMKWNQEQKQLGLPTSDEMQMQDILKDAWSAEGSPFSGPFDPNSVKFN